LIILFCGCRAETDRYAPRRTGTPVKEEIIKIPPEETAQEYFVSSPEAEMEIEIRASGTEDIPESFGYFTDPGDSEEVKLQKALANAGFYKGKIDGKIGSLTKEAIENFQRDNGLKVDGKAGPQTWSVLGEYIK
jgi:murein L,D-transpeptidase YcbB/YkuD